MIGMRSQMKQRRRATGIIERFRVQHGEKRVALLRREHIMKMLAAIQKHLRSAVGLRPFAG
jgi:hypothetical protein